MIIQDTIIDFAQGHWGEDRLCIADGLFCVLDGATPIKETEYAGFHSNAEWMADRLSAHILSHASSSQPYPMLCKAFVDAEPDILHAFPDAHHLPCLTTAALRCEEGQLKCWVLGDCSIYLLMKAGDILHITDERVSHFSQKTVQAKENAIRRGEDPTEAVLSQRIQNKQMMNHPGGYWTVAFSGSFEEEFIAHTIDANQVQSALLCTDGFDRLFIQYNATPREILTEKITLADSVHSLRALERMEKNPEIKPHDDVAAILLKNG